MDLLVGFKKSLFGPDRRPRIYRLMPPDIQYKAHAWPCTYTGMRGGRRRGRGRSSVCGLMLQPAKGLSLSGQNGSVTMKALERRNALSSSCANRATQRCDLSADSRAGMAGPAPVAASPIKPVGNYPHLTAKKPTTALSLLRRIIGSATMELPAKSATKNRSQGT